MGKSNSKDDWQEVPLDDWQEVKSRPAAKPEGIRKWADTGARAVEGAGEAVMAGPVGKGLAYVGDKFERYLDAPFRAAATAGQAGESLPTQVAAAWHQAGENAYPTTKSGGDLAFNAFKSLGASKTPLSDSLPQLFSPTGDGLALKRGGIADVSSAGVVGGVAQPSMVAPVGPLLGPLKNVAGGAAKAGGKFVGATVGPIAEAAGVTANRAADVMKRGVFKTGEFVTGLDAKKAFDASERLSAGQLMLPEAYTNKAGKAVGAARDTIEATGGKLLVPEGSRDALMRVRDIIAAGEKKAAKTPGSAQLLERIDDALTNPNGIPVEAVDDMIRDLNTVEYTVQGNPKSVEPRWSKFLGQARGELGPILETTPDGSALGAVKSKFSDLKTATGSGQASRLRTIMARATGISSVTTAMVLSNPAVAIAAGTAAAAMTPKAYYFAVGAAKLPKSVAQGLMDSYATGKVATIRDTISSLAEKYPEEIARFTSAIANEADASKKQKTAVERRLNSTGK